MARLTQMGSMNEPLVPSPAPEMVTQCGPSTQDVEAEGTSVQGHSLHPQIQDRVEASLVSIKILFQEKTTEEEEEEF